MDREKAFEAADYVSQFARSGTRALFDLATRGLLESDSSVRDRLSVGSARGLQAGGSGCRTSSSCSTSRASTSPPCRASRCLADYQSHFRSFDGKERTLPGRRRGRADLVHRIQRAERPVGALVRPFRRVRDADRRRARHAEPAERAAPLRLSDLQPLSLARRISQRAQLPEDARHRSLLRRQGSRRPATSSPTNSTTPSPPIC